MSADLETAVRITARLYEMRRAARMLRGEKYADDMVSFKKGIRDHAKARDLDLLPAATELANNAQKNGSDIALMLVMAAFVELTEDESRG